MVLYKYYFVEKWIIDSFKKRETVAQGLFRNQSHKVLVPAAALGAPTPSDASLSPLFLQTHRYHTDFSLHQLVVKVRVLTHSPCRERRPCSTKFSKSTSRWCCSKLLFNSTHPLGGTKRAALYVYTVLRWECLSQLSQGGLSN